MAHTFFTNLFLIFSFLSAWSFAQSLDRCPSQESDVPNSISATVKVCSGTNFEGTNIVTQQNVKNVNDCAQYCINDSRCLRAVYDKTALSCSIKTSTTQPWLSNSRFDGIRVIRAANAPQQGAVITQCPSTEANSTNASGSTASICSGTNYEGSNLVTQQNVDSASSCAQFCLSDTRCVRAVYDPAYRSCSIKSSTTAAWTVNSAFNVIRVTRPAALPQQGQTVIACPYQEINSTDASGSTASICSGTNYEGSNLVTQQNVDSASSCAQFCLSDTRCVRAVYDPAYRSCSIKSSTTGAWTVNSAFNAIRASRIAGLPQQGQSIILCPYQEVNSTNASGNTISICSGTNFQGANIITQQNVNSVAECANYCAGDTRCSRAVYDKAYRSCSIKSSNTEQWEINSAFDGIRVSRLSSNDPRLPSMVGKWSDVIQLPVVPGSAYLVPQQPEASTVMVFASDQKLSFGSIKGRTYFANWNYKTGAITERLVAETQHDMFCPGIGSLKDGRVVITGGQNNQVTSIYNPASNSWARASDMILPRGYHSSTVVSDGRLFTIGGSWVPEAQRGGKNGEIFDGTTNTWTLLPGTSVVPMLTADTGGVFRADNHAWLYAWSDGAVLQAGPSQAMNWYSTSGSGSVQAAGNRGVGHDAMCGSNVMYDTGKILGAGGTPDYENNWARSTATITTINGSLKPVTVERVSDMTYRRAFSNAVVLPDGSTMVTGGQEYAWTFHDDRSILTPELFNPTNKTWRILAPHKIGRNYHSTALLLGDGRVYTGGGGLCGSKNGNQPEPDCAVPDANHPNAEIYSPPYLFNADGTLATRPVITSVSSDTVRPGDNIKVTLGSSNDHTFSVIRFGSATHSVNSDQRRLALTSTTKTGSSYDIKLPSDSGILLPGFWMLFALSKEGVPSVARVISVSR